MYASPVFFPAIPGRPDVVTMNPALRLESRRVVAGEIPAPEGDPVSNARLAAANDKGNPCKAFQANDRNDQADAETTVYPDGRNMNRMPPRAHIPPELTGARKKDETGLQTANRRAEKQDEESIDYLNRPPEDLPDFEPANDQAPLAGILTAMGKSVSRLFADLLNISAVENVLLDKINRQGEVRSSLKFKCLYLGIATNEKWGPSFIEYRSDTKGREVSPPGSKEGYMLTSGFISAPLIFHPAHQKGSSFRLLGRQKLRSRNTLVIGYAQIPAQSRLFGTYRLRQNTGTIFKQGMVWIDADSFQIIRVVSDLLEPLPLIRLEKQKTDIEFDEVQLNRTTKKLWLPKQVTVTLNWEGKVLRNTHLYSDFELFSVETMQKIAAPNIVKKTAEESADPAPAARPEAGTIKQPDLPEK